jgi:hypothetical protein
VALHSGDAGRERSCRDRRRPGPVPDRQLKPLALSRSARRTMGCRRET